MNNGRSVFKPAMSLLLLLLALSACSHERAFERQRHECQKVSVESERNRCLQKVEADEREDQRKENETRIEQSYKRKLEDMRPR